MAIILRRSSRIIVQGPLNSDQLFEIQQSLALGTKIVAFVQREKSKESLENLPIFSLISKAQIVSKADVCVIASEGEEACNALVEAALAKIPTIICLSKNIDEQDFAEAYQVMKEHSESLLIGPTVSGIATPGEAYIGSIPSFVCSPGEVGLLGRENALTCVVSQALSQKGIGQSTIVGLRRSRLSGASEVGIIKMFNDDPQTKKIIYIGSSSDENTEEIFRYQNEFGKKMLIAYIPGTFEKIRGEKFLTRISSIEELFEYTHST